MLERHDSYLHKVTDDLKQDEIDRIYKKEVIDPVYDQRFAGGEYEYMGEFLLGNAPKNKPGIVESINETDNKELDNTIIESLISSSNYLSNK